MAIEARKASQKEWATWKTKSAELRRQNNLPRHSKPWTSRSTTQLHGVPDLPRVHDVLNCCFAIERSRNPRTGTAGLTKDLFVDWSQSVERKPWSRGAIRTACTSTMLYSFERDMALTGCNMLQLLGWSATRLPSSRMSDANLKLLAGEAYSLPWVTMLHALLYANPWGEWWR